MTTDFNFLLASIHTHHPESSFRPLAEDELALLREQHPGVPQHYLDFLRRVGWGSLGKSDFMFYSGPCTPDDIFDSEMAERLDGILFLGDNFAGWMLGFDTRKGWQLIGVDSCSSLEPIPERAQSIAEFVLELIKRYEID